MKYTPKPLQGNVNVSPTSPLKELFLLLGGLIGIMIIVYLVLGLAVDVIVPRLPAGLERHLGVLYSDVFDQRNPSPADQALQELLETLIAASPTLTEPYQVHLIPSSQANALALPGGHIVILSELLHVLASENELAFILAHELGHFANRDHLKGLGRGLVLTAISAFFIGVESNLTSFLMRSLVGVEMQFSQRQETQADLFALELLNAHYGHVAGATAFFETLTEDSTRSRLSYFFATHPYP
ncbi:M48 family metalloprotease, partial [candidate division KSB3 bacterium]|nr:M48 family metalloprotease [candidate division KSB3 bacterium]MBD3323364.1 M48 family metalloprotease [candidate division KSB3 bacterium]